jgi:ATP-dependent Clp protease adaptor protein ClpS
MSIKLQISKGGYMEDSNERGNSFSKDYLSEEERSFFLENGYKYPSMYEVLLLNDSKASKSQITEILKKFFHKKPKDKLFAFIKDDVVNMCGVYTKEVAETKIIQVTEYAQNQGYMLKCIMKESR